MLLLDTCAKLGKIKILLNQPANPIVGLTYKDLEIISCEKWIFVEQTALTYLLGYQQWDDFAMVMSDIPNLIYSSDLGQLDQLDIVEWQKISETWFKKIGLSSQRISDITLLNPLNMLTI